MLNTWTHAEIVVEYEGTTYTVSEYIVIDHEDKVYKDSIVNDYIVTDKTRLHGHFRNTVSRKLSF